MIKFILIYQNRRAYDYCLKYTQNIDNFMELNEYEEESDDWNEIGINKG